MRFLGSNAEINISHTKEFCAWRWMPLGAVCMQVTSSCCPAQSGFVVPPCDLFKDGSSWGTAGHSSCIPRAELPPH